MAQRPDHLEPVPDLPRRDVHMRRTPRWVKADVRVSDCDEWEPDVIELDEEPTGDL